jgi:glycerophosphoryl diester phosphodiesterase
MTAFLDQPVPLAFAHRGGAAHNPENSWPAFEHAVSLGYRYLETDLHATADGVLVAFHDPALDRVTDRTGRIARLPYQEVAAARIGGTEPIPKAEDLLATWPQARFNLDVKDEPAIAPLAEVLRRTGAWDRVCVTSFSARRLRATRQALGRPVCMSLSPSGVAAVKTVPFLPDFHPTVPFLPDFHPTVPFLPDSPSTAGNRAGSGPVMARKLAAAGVQCAQVPLRVATRGFIRRAHALGLQVHVWTVNDRLEMNGLLDLGADGIMTDDTVLLRDVLAERGLWHPGARPGEVA